MYEQGSSKRKQSSKALLLGVLLYFFLLINCSLAFVTPQRTTPSFQSTNLHNCFRLFLSASRDTEKNESKRTNHLSRRELFSIFRTATLFAPLGFPLLHPLPGQATNEQATRMRIQASGPEGMKRPYAPIEYLLPATRVRIYIDRLVQLAEDQASSSETVASSSLEELQALLLGQPKFLSPTETKRAQNYLQEPTWEEWNRARQKEAADTANFMRSDSSPVNPLLAQLDTSLQQWGSRQQFLRLRRRQLSLERQDNIRAALNMYTNNLVFGENYELNLDREEKKRLIRDDRLPDMSAVIVSDLDLRDLFRNQVLDAMDNARAELEYQLSSKKEGGFDGTELLSLLKQAQQSLNEWFSLISEKDAQKALDEVVREG